MESTPLNVEEQAPPGASEGSVARPADARVNVRRILWPVALSLVVLVVIGYYTFDPEALRQLGRDINGWLVGAALLTVVTRVLFGAWRLDYFAHGRLGLGAAVRGQIAWDFFSGVVPSTVGGGPLAAAYFARDRHLPLGDTTAIVLFAMLLDQIGFALMIPGLLVAASYLDVIPGALGSVGAWTITAYYCVFMAWVLVFGYSGFFRPHLLKKLVDRVCRVRWLRRYRERALSVMGRLQEQAGVLRAQPPGFYVKGFLLTLVPWISRYLLSLFIIWSVYPGLDRWLVFLRSIAMSLVAIAMPTPGGAGGVEGLYALFLGPPLMPEGLVAPTLLAWRILSYYVFIVAGAYLTMRHLQRRYIENNARH